MTPPRRAQVETIEVDVQANDIGDAGAPTIVVGPAHGTASIGSIIYTPAAGFSGTDEIVYRVCSPTDETVCSDATLAVTVSAAAPPPSLPPTDAGPALGTPLAVPGTMATVLGLIAFLATVALVAVVKRRGSMS